MNVLRQDLYEISQQFDIDVPALQGDLTCAFVGEWNHGKSSLLNSMIGAPFLPEKPTPTTKTIVRLSKSIDPEPQTIVYKDSETKSEFHGVEAVEALQESTEQVMRIDFKSPQIDIPEHTVFVDTPGFNDTDQVANTKAETVQADVVVFVLNCTVSALNQTQIDFIRQAILCKADIKDLFIVFTHSDSLEDEEDYDDLRQRVGVHLNNDQVFFLSNKNQQGVQEFKEALYTYLNNRQKVLIEERQQRYDRELSIALQQKVIIKRAALEKLKSKSCEEKEELQKKIQDARYKERNKKKELRSSNHLRLRDSLRELRELTTTCIDEIGRVVDNSNVEQLQRKGFIQDKIQEMMGSVFQPQVESKLKTLLEYLQKDVSDGQLYSKQLMNDLDIELPEYSSRLSAVSAEHIMPLAIAGSYLMFGLFSVPTLVIGYLTFKAREFGLTRIADRTGLLDSALDKAKELGASSYKHTIKMSVAKSFTNYLNEVSDHYNNILEETIEKAIQKINFVEELETTMQRLISSTEIVQLEMNLDKAETILNLVNTKSD